MKLFADRRFLPPGTDHVVLLYPFWGPVAEDPAEPESGRYDRYTRDGARHFELAPLDSADVVVLPAPWEQVLRTEKGRELAGRLHELARAAGKPLVVFFNSDATEPVALSEAVVFRTSFFRSTRLPTEFALPAWSEDFVERYFEERLPLRPKGEKPRVGFCGYATPVDEPLARKAFRWARRPLLRIGLTSSEDPEWNPGARLRGRALRLLARSPAVTTDFHVRDRFLGGALHAPAGERAAAKRAVRLEFVRNLADTDYTLCVRGGGNFSYRLYETLSLGRIPLLVETDCVLPYDFTLDWKRFVVRVPADDLDRIAEAVADFHSGMTPADFEELQKVARRTWLDWLSPQGFFAQFHRHFQGAVRQAGTA